MLYNNSKSQVTWCEVCCWCWGLGGNPGPGEWLEDCEGWGEDWLAGVEFGGGPGLPGPCWPVTGGPNQPLLPSP